MRCHFRGFTIVELLVVITIIVVLLSLLAPAMDRAVYQAELAMCMGNLRGVAMGSQGYALSHSRHYPSRPSIDEGYWNRPTNLCDTVVDDRPILRGFVEPKAMVDPMCRRVDLGSSPTATHVFSSYNLWFGVRYTINGTRYPGQLRLGDRLVVPNPTTGGNYRFDILAGDYDSIYEYNDFGVFTSHPDKDGLLAPTAGEGANSNQIGTVPVPAASSYGPDVYTLSRWEALGNPKRGLIDLHFSYGDGSVRRLTDVRWDDWKLNDARTFGLPVQTRGGILGTGYPFYWDHIPLQ